MKNRAQSPAIPSTTRLLSASDPPASLGPAGAQLWRQIQNQYAISDAGGLAILEECCLMEDRAAACARALADEGLTTTSATGVVRPHPLLAAEVSARSFIVRALARLGLNLEPIRAVGRPGSSVGVSWRDLPNS